MVFDPVGSKMTKTCVCNHADCVLCPGRIFNGLTSDQDCQIRGVCQIRGLIKSISYPAHTLLFHVRAPADLLFILKTGCVKLTTALANGREQILRLVFPGQMFGFVFREDSFYPYSACAVTEVNVCAVRHRDIKQILDNDPGVSLRMIRVLNGELEHSLTLIRDLGLNSSTVPMASFLLSLIPLRRGRTSDFALPLTRREISEILGLNMETVRRAMTGFQRAGIIRVSRGWVQILNAEKLWALAEGGSAPVDSSSSTCCSSNVQPREAKVIRYDRNTGTHCFFRTPDRIPAGIGDRSLQLSLLLLNAAHRGAL
jgi:CRP-like cAMP-binding protein